MTPEQIKVTLKMIQDKNSEARLAFDKQRMELEGCEDLRDDVISMIKNSGMSFSEIHARCGPHPHTLENWARKDIKKPQIGKMRAALRVIGFDLGVVDKTSDSVVFMNAHRARFRKVDE
jgi:hypothetical protein